MLQEENISCFFLLTCLCFVTVLMCQCKRTACLPFPLLSVWGCLVLFVLFLLEKTMHASFCFYMFLYTNPICITHLLPCIFPSPATLLLHLQCLYVKKFLAFPACFCIGGGSHVHVLGMLWRCLFLSLWVCGAASPGLCTGSQHRLHAGPQCALGMWLLADKRMGFALLQWTHQKSTGMVIKNPPVIRAPQSV